MYVSARDRRILDELLAHPEGVTVSNIASAIDVSERTIHRDLASFDSLLQPYELFLEKKAGQGVRLTGSSSQLSQFQADLHQARHFDFLPEQRQLLLSYKLLTSSEPVKLQALASDLHITNATVSSDLDKVTEWLESYHLSLLRRRGFGIQIVGEEAAKRRAISGLLSDHIGETELLRFIRRNTISDKTGTTQSIADQLLGFVHTDRLQQIETAVERINATLPIPIADSSYIALVVHLALAMERIQQGENVQMKETLLTQLRQTSEFKLAGNLAAELTEIFSVDIPEAEIGYITMHLRGAKLQTDESYQADPDMDVSFIVKRLIKHVGLEYGVDFSANLSLEKGLGAHISPALYRLQQEMKIHNPLVETIKANYPALFQAVADASRHLFPEMAVPDDEIGFLVLHFGSALESEEQTQDFRAFVICSSGIGSSKMMSSRLKKEFPQIQEIHQLSMFDLKETQIQPEDLVISTVYLDDPQIDYIQVNPFLTKEEVSRLETYMAGKALQRKKRAVPKKSPVHNGQETLETLQSQLAVTVKLMHHVALIQEATVTGLWQSMYNTLVYIEKKQLITSASAVLQQLKDREKLSGVGIPGTSFALYHAKSNEVKEPVFYILERQQAETIAAMDGNTIEASRICIMLAPEEMTSEEAGILSHVSGMMVKDQESMHIFAQGTEEEIKNFMSEEFLQLYRNK
ncbi:BglG family transcription antiterminator [Alkalicoccus daliensis]|uniref:Mannitol operon transcriptional antiterminator n=1 Tax=Alkalicoccus daliensis TaxID=745820 RepID=A0A1H0ERZ3_9BACI|nr:BglG family transcription antiterminator [Alkalicoccus daliensis]SDN85158.1 mannitol operon transcriptional antiterminator [Alkalicoccus daliensis]